MGSVFQNDVKFRSQNSKDYNLKNGICFQESLIVFVLLHKRRRKHQAFFCACWSFWLGNNKTELSQVKRGDIVIIISDFLKNYVNEICFRKFKGQ